MRSKENPSEGSGPEFSNNREKYREFFWLCLKIAKFCPKSANLPSEQGIKREFCGYLLKPAWLAELPAFLRGFEKLTGNLQGDIRESLPEWQLKTLQLIVNKKVIFCRHLRLSPDY